MKLTIFREIIIQTYYFKSFILLIFWLVNVSLCIKVDRIFYFYLCRYYNDLYVFDLDQFKVMS